MPDFFVFQPGASVLVGDSIPAKVLAVRIGRNYLVQYEVVLWDKAVRSVLTVEESEVTAGTGTATTTIGFRDVKEV
jgi:hypothetical protein